MMATLTKEQILKAEDLKTEIVEVEEWGGSVNVRTMTGTERDAFEQSIVEGKDKTNLANIRARLCAVTIVDENGNRLFNDEDVVELGKKSAAALDRVATVAQKLNGFRNKDIEELGKNLSKGQSGDSISA
jgi:hypothetical protein